MIDDNCIQTIIDKYFQQTNILVNHQIDSYNDFIDTILPKLISQFFPLTISFSDKSGSVSPDAHRQRRQGHHPGHRRDLDGVRRRRLHFSLNYY